MKAACITHVGGIDALSINEVKDPERAEGETIVRVQAVGLNWLDVLLRTEEFGLAFPHVPGSDVVGIVEETRSDAFQPGDSVVVNPAIPCGTCPGESDDPNLCRFVRILGVHTGGGYGELVSVPDSQLYATPAGLTVAEAAAFPLDYLTAWRMLVTKAALQPDESVLIWGSTGALGSAATRIASALGATVIATTGSPEFADDLLSIGARYVVDYKRDDVAKRVKEFTKGAGADCVFESIGASTFAVSMQAVRPHGRIVICGTRSGNHARVDLEDLYYNQIRIMGSRMGTRSEFERLLSNVTQPSWKPMIADELPVGDIRKAHELLESRTAVGKIVLHHG